MMTQNFYPADWLVLILYFAGTMGIGFYFYRKSRSSESFTAGNRSLPGWVCGLSIFATYVSSISYLALPGASFAGNWNPFAFSLSIPLVAWFAARYFLPYYRMSGEVSAYALLEHRFGVWARIYASIFYLLTQLARIAVVLYLMALPMQVIFGWNIYTILIVTGVCVTVYAFVGGIVAVIWADALQAIVLMAGAIICLAVMLFQLPGGTGELFAVAGEYHKFSLGSFGGSITEATFWVVLFYGLTINLQNFGIDQSYIQRYISSGSDKEAKKALWLGALLYVPVSALFFFIGTTLFVFYDARALNAKSAAPVAVGAVAMPEKQSDLEQVKGIVARQKLIQQGGSPADPDFDRQQAEAARGLALTDIGDRVFPHFIATHLPPGLTGLLIAAVFAAAMSTVSTSLNSSATLIMSDYYRRFVNRQASEKQSMRVLYAGTIAWGILGTGLALVLVSFTQGALNIWWTLSGIFGGGMTGLFLLGMISRRARNPAAISGVAIGVALILWLSLPKLVPDWESLVHAYLIPVIGTLAILIVGMAISAIVKKPSIRERI
jgi:SSS family solute:Na+ symporter